MTYDTSFLDGIVIPVLAGALVIEYAIRWFRS